MTAELEGWVPLPVATAPPLAGAVDALLAWAAAEGAWFEPIAIAEATDGNRGVVTRRAVAAGEPLVVVPRRLMISDVDVAAHPAVAPLVPHQDRLASRHSLMARWLVGERTDLASRWRPYVAALPSTFAGLPLHRPAAQLAGLAGTAALAAIVALAEGYRADHALLDRLAPGGSLAAFAWGRAIAGSRCYHIVGADGSARALVPVADMFDHGPAAAHWCYDDDRRQFEVTAARPLTAGEPVTISYGQHANARLLSAYGFAIADNPDDEVVIHLPGHDGPRALPVGSVYDPRFQLAMATALAWPDTSDADALHRIAAAAMDRGATIAAAGAATVADDPAWAALCAIVRASERAIAPAVVAFVDEVTRGGCDRPAAAWRAIVDAIAPDAVGAARLMRSYAQVAIDHARPAAAD